MAKYSGAREYKDGAIVQVLANVPMNYSVAGDEVKTYIHVLTSHNGSHATTVIATAQRCICQNILNDKQAVYTRFRHTRNYRLKVDEAKVIFNHYRNVFNRQKEAFEHMASKQFNQLQIDSFLNELLNITDSEEKSQTNRKNQKAEMKRLFVEGKGNGAYRVAGTGWAAYNAVTEYVDHYRSTKGDASNREYASLVGSGASLREKAYSILTR